MMNGKPDLMAVSADPSMFTKYGEELHWLGINVKESRVIDYTDDGRIAFIKYPGNNEIFHYYQQQSWQFILALFIVVLVLSGLINNRNFRIKIFIETCLDILSLLLAKNFPRSLKNCDHKILFVLGPYLLLILFQSIRFCNWIMDDKMKKINDKVIDSWDDLALVKDVQIVGLQNDFITEFVEQDNDMARNFKTRFNKIEINRWLTKEFLTEMAMNISTGKAVFIKNRSTLIFLLMNMANYIRDIDTDFLDHVHVSRHGSTNLPCFIPSFHSSDHPYNQDLDKVYVAFIKGQGK